MRAAKLGEAIELIKPPDFITVEIFPNFDVNHDKTMKKTHRIEKSSLVSDGKIVITSSVSNKKNVKFKRAKIRGVGGILTVTPSL